MPGRLACQAGQVKRLAHRHHRHQIAPGLCDGVAHQPIDTVRGGAEEHEADTAAGQEPMHGYLVEVVAERFLVGKL